jgi:hypothetical protein
MTCPRCGLADAGEVSCARCGVVYAKLGAGRADRRAPRPAPERAKPVWPWVAVGALAMAGAAFTALRSPSAPPAVVPVSTAVVPRVAPPVAADIPPPDFAPIQAFPSAPPLELKAEGMSDADRDAARKLAARLGSAGEAEVAQAEELHARHAGDVEVRRLLGSVLVAAAQRAHAQHHDAAAVAWLQKAATLIDGAPVRLALVDVLLENGDWAGAEAAARGALAAEPRSALAWSALGYALLRQDRSREAAEALRSALGIQDDPSTRALLARVEKGMRDESGMTQQTLSHFNVRYDGEAHESVGHEILRALERHYATLASTLDHQPATTIPVVLFTGEAYYDASGAPAWSGGVYDTIDGRIRIPIGGLTPSLTADMDGTLLHELTHAFVADRTHGVAERDLHEGLAQYMEGKRCDTLLGPEGMRALADGRVPGVYGFYAGALSFVEYLIALRGVGGINDLLREMAETGSSDEAFKTVHGRGHDEMRRQWRERLRQQYGS